ncbi:MAG: coenzyme F420-0:L-glutamate ligase [Paracoccaceae bacterium]|nr:coenzyme F420-0:L-glutamate ligase [Paracoccaceae bacterium]MDG2260259.1 coenzyme F420-0:L-glutamate ligase [Paracoccaceae bacterium]
MTDQIVLTPLDGLPLVEKGDDLCGIVVSGLEDAKIEPKAGDIFVGAQKVISKAEGRTVDLNTVSPGKAAMDLATETGKDPRVVELILSESKSVIRKKTGVLIVEHNRGWIMANAGIDASNVSSSEGAENVLLLPLDPDESARKLRDQLVAHFGCDIAVVISDSFGRPWRIGTTGVAIGSAGLPSLWDRRGETDLFGRELLVTQQAIGDEVATAASLLQGQTSEGRPVVHIRGLDYSAHASAIERPAKDLIRDASEDLFR